MNVLQSFIAAARGPALTQVALEWAGLLAHPGARLVLVRAKQRGMFRCPCSIQNMRQFVFNSRCDLAQAT